MYYTVGACWLSILSLAGHIPVAHRTVLKVMWHPEWIYVYGWLSPFAVHLKLSQHCLLIGYTSIQNGASQVAQ